MLHPHYEIHGNDGPVLLLVHGMLSGRAQWLLNLPALSRTCRAVVMELWGHGRSPTPTESDYYSYPHYLEQLEWLRQELEVEQWFVCGQSFGATLTMRYAIEHPQRVLGQIFTNSASALVGVARAEGQTRPRGDPDRMMQMVIDGGREYIEQMRIHPRHARNLPEVAKQALLEDAAMVNARALAMMFRHLGESSVVGMLDRTRVPSLLVCGAREAAFAPGRANAEEKIAGLEVVAAQAGHAVNIQQAETFNDAVIGFMARHSGRSR